MKIPFWRASWAAGAAVVLVFGLLALTPWSEPVERSVYDFGMSLTDRAPSDRIAVIAIDDASINNLGRWPWPRDLHARMVKLLADAHAKLIGYTVFFFEPQKDPGLSYVEAIGNFWNHSGLSALKEPPLADEAAEMSRMIADAYATLDTDKTLGASLKTAGNVYLPLLFIEGVPHGKPDQPMPDFVQKDMVTRIGPGADVWLQPKTTIQAFSPIPSLGQAAAGVGHLTSVRDADGAVRGDALAVDYFGQFYPSLSVSLAAASLNLGADAVEIVPYTGLRIGTLDVVTDDHLQMLTYFYRGKDGQPPFQVDSFFDVLSGKIPAEKYRDKIVLIGATAAGVGASQVTPVSSATPPVLILAHTLSTILQGDYFVRPAWGVWATLAVFVLLGVYLLALLPKLKAAHAAYATGGLLFLVVGGEMVLLVAQSIWVPLVLPAAMLFVGHLALTTQRFLVTEKSKLKSEAESAESNRLLGLAFQGQGQLDMAFEKFRKCPLDKSMMDVLYNLALDFERKRQFNKATSVFQYMADFDPDFRDLKSRLARSKALEETVILGGGGGRTNASLLSGEDGSIEKPMLGRYQVEKELGKGAMGVVYLGQDPKIGRQVAIKTMALSQEFDEDELEDVKSRFFREAETAGRLNHPNIVTIYDAGEEHDLAYIAMELLSGQDLAPYTKAGNLLALGKTLKIIGKVASALHYAHGMHVVHRDIKPANIMYEPETETIKVTDFGIARITDSSKTKTGMVLGTPSYMSPEQLAGKKVDGRSDLFSLGAMFYQLLTGVLPFQGESMAELMYRIANEPQKDLREINPRIPACIAEIVNKMLEKQPEQRYQTGEDVARAIIQCASQLSAARRKKG